MALTPHEVATLVAQCAYDAVPHDGDWPILRHGVVIGDIVWDNCECGQLVVSETRRYPSRQFPLEEVSYSDACNEPWIVVQYELSLTRCVAGPDDNGNPPSIVSLTASAQRNSNDMTAVRRAVLCCLSEQYDTDEIDAYELSEQTVVGPGGMCAGFTLTFFIGFTNDCECT